MDERAPWVADWCSLDMIIEEASRRPTRFAIESAEPWNRVFVDRQFVGLADPHTLDFIHWPYIPSLDLSGIEYAHRRADEDRTVAKCYFIGGATGAIKIGFSVDPIGRLRAIRAASPIPLSILALVSGGEARESAYHRQFDAWRLHGEWFERCPAILAEIGRLNGLTIPETPTEICGVPNDLANRFSEDE